MTSSSEIYRILREAFNSCWYVNEPKKEIIIDIDSEIKTSNTPPLMLDQNTKSVSSGK